MRRKAGACRRWERLTGVAKNKRLMYCCQTDQKKNKLKTMVRRQGLRRIIGMLTLACTDLTEKINSQRSWVVDHISEPKILYTLLTPVSRKAPPRPRQNWRWKKSIWITTRPDIGQALTSRMVVFYSELNFSVHIIVTKQNSQWQLVLETCLW